MWNNYTFFFFFCCQRALYYTLGGISGNFTIFTRHVQILDLVFVIWRYSEEDLLLNRIAAYYHWKPKKILFSRSKILKKRICEYWLLSQCKLRVIQGVIVFYFVLKFSVTGGRKDFFDRESPHFLQYLLFVLIFTPHRSQVLPILLKDQNSDPNMRSIPYTQSLVVIPLGRLLSEDDFLEFFR